MAQRKPKPPAKPDFVEEGHDPSRETVQTLLAKALVLTGKAENEATAITNIQETEQQWSEEQAVVAPYDPESLLSYVELCGHLSPNIDAYAQNIEGFGYAPEPISEWMKDLESEEAREKIREALEIERWYDFEQASLDDDQMDGVNEPVAVSDQDVEEALKRIKAKLRRETYLFESWFRNCCSESSFTKLRRSIRWDREAAGWGCIELIRDERQRLRRISYVPGYTVRPLVDEGERVEVVESDPITPLSDGRQVRVRRHFRRFVQIVGTRKVFFKSPGDPRVVSKETGRFYETIEDLHRAEPNNDAANELLWFAGHSPKTPCAPPRWIPNLLAVLGTREADEVNYYYFTNKSIPPAIVFVAGGRIPKDIRQRLESRIQAELHGAKNFHRVMVVEAMPVRQNAISNDRSMLPQIHYQELGNQAKDGMFLEYDQRAADRIGSSFRQSPIMRGYTPKNLNRATANTVLKFTEQQVYKPERDDFDWVMNDVILPELGIELIQFKTLGPTTRTPDELADYIKVVAPHGGLIPQEIRRLTSKVLGMDLDRIDEDWARVPMPMTLADARNGFQPNADEDLETNNDVDEMRRLREFEQKAAAFVRKELQSLGFDNVAVKPGHEVAG